MLSMRNTWQSINDTSFKVCINMLKINKNYIRGSVIYSFIKSFGKCGSISREIVVIYSK